MEKAIQIRCFDKCVYTLNFPKFFEEYAVVRCKKLFQYLFRFDYLPGNNETIAFLDNALPALIEDKKVVWHDKSIEYQNGYLSTDRAALPSNLFFKKQINEEIARRKKSNEALMRKVKAAKSQYEHAKKVWESYTDEKQKTI